MAPRSGSVVDGNTIQFDGLTDAPNARVRIDAYDWFTAKWFYQVETRTASTPTFAAGQICPNSPALYRYSASAQLIWPIYWHSVGGVYQAKVRATQLTAAEMALKFTENPNPGSCMAEHAFNSTCDFYLVAYDTCGLKLNDAIIWTTDPSPWI